MEVEMKRQRSQNKQRPGKKTKYTHAPLVTKDRDAYKLYKSFSPDFKVTDAETLATASTTTPTFHIIHTNMTQGTSWYNNFIGKEVTPVGIDVRFVLQGAVGNAILTADLNNITRIMIFQWLDDAAITAAGVLQTTPYTISPINIANYDNINVLVDEVLPTWVHSNTATSSNSNGYHRRWYIKGKKCRNICFNSTGSSTVKGALFALITSDSSLTPNPVFSIYTRMTYLDV